MSIKNKACEASVLESYFLNIQEIPLEIAEECWADEQSQP